ncbi:MAG TPA: ABC transporter permease subunit, partial [Tepidisphaeraceae bacterium]|nr:ABC transporter permease subunit [Tepidisphaeraceae bacterium]
MNPVLRKDLLGLLRLRRVAAIQVLFVAVLAVMVLATWPQGGVMAVAAQGRDSMLLGLVLGQLVLLILFVPGVAAVSLVGEREANTFEMLYASRLSPASILAGKVLSAVAFPLMLLIAGLPFVALLAWRGAVDVDTLAKSYAILTVTSVFLAILSLAVSAVSRQTATALVVAYAIVLIVCGGLLVPGAIMLESSSDLTAAVLHYARGLSPVAAALSVLQPGLSQFGGRPDQGLGPLWQVFLPAAVLVTLA